MRRLLVMMDRAAGQHLPLWRRTVTATVAGAVLQGAAIVVLLPLVTSLVAGDQDRVLLFVGVVVGLLVVESMVRLRELDFGYRHLPDVMRDTRLRLGRHLRSMPAEELGRRRSGELSVVLSGDVSNALMAVGEVATLFLRLIVVPAALLAALLVIDPRLPLAALVGAVVTAPALIRQNRTMAAGAREIGDRDGDAADRVVEYVQGLPVLKAADQAGDRSQRLTDALAAQGSALNATMSRLTGLLTVSAVGANLAVAGIIAAGTALVLGADLTPTMLAAVVVAAAGLADPIARASAMTAVFELAEAGMERINDLLAVAPLPVPADPRGLTSFDITFEDVSFTYRDGTTPALHAVSLSAPAGSLTALVGPSGGGKTTVTRLITRWADPHAGAVRVGGVDLRAFDPAHLMRHIAVVFQDVHLFDATIAENVAMARPSATPGEVAAALEEANCGLLLERLPRGADTRVGEVGGMLSGGERQRVAIARALLKQAPIVLLDEPTSALDTESEVAVQQAIDRLVVDRTVLVIAHRLSTVAAADQILVLEAGRVIESGDHTSLLNAGGRYARMWAAQTRARHWTVPGGTATNAAR